MRKFKFAKLVRDKIVEGIISVGNKPAWRTLSTPKYIEELKKKLLEEAQEIPQTDNTEVVKELADVQEIIDNLIAALQVSPTEFKKIQAAKNAKNGSFQKRQYIDTVEAQDDSEWTKYYLAHPGKYAEVKD